MVAINCNTSIANLIFQEFISNSDALYHIINAPLDEVLKFRYLIFADRMKAGKESRLYRKKESF